MVDELHMFNRSVAQQDVTRLIDRGIKATFAQKKEDSDRRRRGRVNSTGSVTSNLGSVLNISGGGLRVLSKTKVEGEGRVDVK